MSFETNPYYQWPDSEEKIWLNPYLFLHNWSSHISIKSRWNTDVSMNRNIGEIRVGLIDRPYRTVVAHYTGMSKDQVLSYQMILAKMGKSRFWFPLYSDVSYLMNSISSNLITTTTSEPIIIPCDTTDRRFYSGKYIAIAKVDVNNKSKTPYINILKISEVYDSYLVATGTVTRNYPIGSKVFPLIIGQIVKSVSADSITDQILDGSITVKEIIGKTSLPASANNKEITTSYSATVSPVGEEYPILNVRPDWRESSTQWKRELDVDVSGRGEMLQTYGERPLISKSLTFTFLNRESAFSFIEMFDSRRGRLHPFFLLSELNEYSEIFDISSNRKQISIQYTGSKINWAFRPYIGIRLTDGTYIVRKVCDVLATSTTTQEALTTTDEPDVILESVYLETPLPDFDLENVHRLHVSYLVRFGSDELEEIWLTDSIMQCDVSFTELDEKNIEYEINYYGTTSTTLEPTTTEAPTTTPIPVPGIVTDYFWIGGPNIEDTNRGEAFGYFVGWTLTMTSGNANGSYGDVTYWGGPGYPWFGMQGEINPEAEWDVQVDDTYLLT